MGGAVTTNSTWRWCFYINLPIGAIAMSVIAFFFEAVHRAVYLPWRERLEQFVIIGTVLFISSIVCVLLAMQMGGTTYAWSSGRIIALFVIFGVTLIAFIAVQFWRPQYAALSPSVLGKRNAWASALFAFFMGSAYYVAVYCIPIWFQAVKNVSANESGIRNIPLLLAVVFGTIASGAGVTIFGFYTPFMLVSTALASIGAGLLTTWDVDTGSGKWIGYQIVLGLGIGIGLQLPMVAIQTVLDASEIPIATALIIFCQLFGASIFVSVGDNAITNDLEYIAENIPGVDAAQVALAGATNIASEIPSQYLPGFISAYNNAITTVFIIVIVMACSTIFGSAPMKWVSVKGKNVQGGAGA